jgi:hypothetical protein
MKRQLLVIFLATFAVLMLATGSHVSPTFAYAGTTVYVDPPVTTRWDNQTVIGDTITVTLNYGNMSDLAGIEYKLFWNSSIIRVMTVHDTLPWSGNPFTAVNQTNNDFNVTSSLGRMYFSSASLAGPAASSNGTFRTITFNITSSPSTGDLNSAIYWGPYGVDTVFGDSSAALIPAEAISGQFLFIHIIPEYSPLAFVLILAVATTIVLVVYRKKQ